MSFGCDLEDPKLRRFLRKEAVDQTFDTNKKMKLWNKKKKQGAAEGADRAEAWESVTSRVSIWHASSPERGAADLWATASSADLRILVCVSGDLDCELLVLCLSFWIVGWWF